MVASVPVLAPRERCLYGEDDRPVLLPSGIETVATASPSGRVTVGRSLPSPWDAIERVAVTLEARARPTAMPAQITRSLTRTPVSVDLMPVALVKRLNITSRTTSGDLRTVTRASLPALPGPRRFEVEELIVRRLLLRQDTDVEGGLYREDGAKPGTPSTRPQEANRSRVGSQG
jgi:hypothetical protein